MNKNQTQVSNDAVKEADNEEHAVAKVSKAFAK
jgi:hypothetical protein